MEIYIKNKNGSLQQTSLMHVIREVFSEANLTTDSGAFTGEDNSWVEIKQETTKPSEINVSIGFTNQGNTITNLSVFETPIKTVVDSDNTKQII